MINGVVFMSIAYCWSYDLIPVVSKLYQTLDGLFTIVRTSLTFALLKVRMYVLAFMLQFNMVTTQFSMVMLCSWIVWFKVSKF